MIGPTLSYSDGRQVFLAKASSSTAADSDNLPVEQQTHSQNVFACPIAVFNMANRQSIAWCMRNFTSLSGLSAKLRALSLSSTTRCTTATAVARPSIHIQTRALSSGILQPASRCATSGALTTGTLFAQRVPMGPTGRVQQQLRGMKVHSSIKKRCEHCKVRMIWRAPYNNTET